MIPLRKTIRNIERFITHRILHADDTPHRLAMGIALGFFVAWTPTIGFQMIIVLLLATAFKANRAAGIPIVWISNPFTLVPILSLNYAVGKFLLGIFGERPEISIQQFSAPLEKIKGLLGYILQHFHEATFWHDMYGMFIKVINYSLDLWIGSLLIGFFLGLLSYIVSYKFIVWYRTHTPRGRLHVLRMLRRKEKKHGQK